MRALWLLWLIGCGSGAPSAGGDEPAAPAGASVIVALGQPVVYPERTFTVTKALDHGDTLPAHRGAIADPQPGKRFIEVHFTEKSHRAEPSSALFLPRLEDDAGRAYSGVAVGIAKLYLPKGSFEYRWHTLQPGEEKPFVALYEVSDASAKGLRLHVWPTTLGEGNGAPALIPLGL